MLGCHGSIVCLVLDDSPSSTLQSNLISCANRDAEGIRAFKTPQRSAWDGVRVLRAPMTFRPLRGGVT